MADKKISELNSLTGANAADGDLVAIVDVSATETKKITRSEFFTDTPSIDVGGTVTADELTVGNSNVGSNTSHIANMTINNNGYIGSAADTTAIQITTAGGVNFTGGDISFYEDTGTTPKFFWDASAESLGIGTSSPTSALDVTGTVTADGLTMASGSQGVIGVFGTSGLQLIGQTGSDNIIGTMGVNEPLVFRTVSTEKMRIDISGNVGIGTSSPASPLHIYATIYPEIRLTNTTTGSTASDGVSIQVAGTTKHLYIWNHETADTIFGTSNTERMRIDSSGNVGIGTSSPTNALDVNSDSIRVRTSQTPATASATGNQGEIAWDADYIYICVATNTWKRVAVSTW